jgi:hypothetical protein
LDYLKGKTYKKILTISIEDWENYKKAVGEKTK